MCTPRSRTSGPLGCCSMKCSLTASVPTKVGLQAAEGGRTLPCGLLTSAGHLASRLPVEQGVVKAGGGIHGDSSSSGMSNREMLQQI